MKLILSADHVHFFQQNLWIEFEGLFSDADMSSHAHALLGKRTSIPTSQLRYTAPLQLFQAGRNLFQEDALIKKWSTHKRFAQILRELTHQHPIQIACDQYLLHSSSSSPLPFAAPTSLKNTFCFQPILGGALLCLSAIPAINGNGVHKEGNVLFLHPDLKIPLHVWLAHLGFEALLIVYGSEKTVYVHQKMDPSTHALKAAGLVFGDRLPYSTYPVLVH